MTIFESEIQVLLNILSCCCFVNAVLMIFWNILQNFIKLYPHTLSIWLNQESPVSKIQPSCIIKISLAVKYNKYTEILFHRTQHTTIKISWSIWQFLNLKFKSHFLHVYFCHCENTILMIFLIHFILHIYWVCDKITQILL